jgi:hypothetical protein
MVADFVVFTVRFAIQGQLLRILISDQTERRPTHENQEAGYREVRFDGSSLATWVCHCRLSGGAYVVIKMSLLLK